MWVHLKYLSGPYSNHVSVYVPALPACTNWPSPSTSLVRSIILASSRVISARAASIACKVASDFFYKPSARPDLREGPDVCASIFFEISFKKSALFRQSEACLTISVSSLIFETNVILKTL